MAYHKKTQKSVSAKIRKIKKEGIRGKKVSQKQAVAVALSMAREHGMKVGKVGKKKDMRNRDFMK